MNVTKTLEEIRFAIIEEIRPKAISGLEITEELIDFHIGIVRSSLIKNDLNKGYSIDSTIIQDLGCLNLVLVDRSECCSNDLGCVFLRTEKQLPSFVEMHNRPVITRVGSIDRLDRKFDLIDYERVPYISFSKYTKGIIRAFMMNSNNYLYIAVHPDNYKTLLLEKVNVQGVLEDPLQLKDFITCEGKPCFTEKSTYPVKSWMIKSIIDILVKKFSNPATLIDTSNNNKNDYSQPIDEK